MENNLINCSFKNIYSNSLLCDKILTHLSAKECVNAILTFRRETEYIVHYLEKQQKKKEFKNGLIIQLLLPHCLNSLNSLTVYRHFDLIWSFLNLNDTPEEFFIKNSHLISTSKLRRLKHSSIKFDESEKYRFNDCIPYKEKRQFSSRFSMEFPEYLTLQICYECADITDVTGKLCNNCSKNKCDRCGFVDLPKLIYGASAAPRGTWYENGCCSGCLGCKQYDYFSD